MVADAGGEGSTSRACPNHTHPAVFHREWSRNRPLLRPVRPMAGVSRAHPVGRLCFVLAEAIAWPAPPGAYPSRSGSPPPFVPRNGHAPRPPHGGRVPRPPGRALVLGDTEDLQNMSPAPSNPPHRRWRDGRDTHGKGHSTRDIRSSGRGLCPPPHARRSILTHVAHMAQMTRMVARASKGL